MPHLRSVKSCSGRQQAFRAVPFYDRIELIKAALHTAYKALAEGVLFVVIILLFFLGNIRSALAVTIVLVVAPLVTFIVMYISGVMANLMCTRLLTPFVMPD